MDNPVDENEPLRVKSQVAGVLGHLLNPRRAELSPANAKSSPRTGAHTEIIAGKQHKQITQPIWFLDLCYNMPATPLEKKRSSLTRKM